MSNENQTKSGKRTGQKVLIVIIAILLMIAISAMVATIIHRRGGSGGVNVKDGLSAYELAVANGFDGSIQDWLDSLQGKSAYEVAKENGYTGSEEEWAKSLQATAGKDGESVKSASFSADGELLLTLSDGTVLNAGKAVGANGKDGKNGADGKDGIDGKNGIDGKDGIGVSSAKVNGGGQLILSFSDGSSVNLDRVVGMNGKDGIGIETSEIDPDGFLVLTYTNRQTARLGKVIGANGKDGRDGIDGAKGDKGDTGETGAAGADGISITSAVVNEAGELVLTYSNGSSANLGLIVGKDGRNGIDGTDGKDGANGKDGISVLSAEINSDGELVLSYSNGQRSNLGNVIGAAGKDGKDDKDGADGAKGETGETGAAGADGKDGIGVIKSEINNRGELVLTYSDNTVANLGVVVGANGKDGADGAKGEKGDTGAAGADGKDGRGIAKTELVNGELVITYTDGTSDNLGAIGGAVEDSSAYLDFELLSDGTWKVSIKESVKSSIESVTIPSTYNGRTVSTVGSFTGCPNLMKVVLPNTIKTISNSAFSGAKFTSIDLPEGLETIGNYAFAQVKLTEIVIPDSAKTIGAGAFEVGMAPSELFASLEKVTIGNNVVFIGDGVFAGQTKLTSVTIPASVSKMVEPFRGCSGLKTVYFEDSSNWYAGYCMSPYTEIPTHPTDKNVSAIFADPSLAATELQRKTTDASRYAWYKTE